MLGKKKTSEVVDKINNTQRAAMASIIKKIQKDIEDGRGGHSREYDVVGRVNKIMESDPVIVDLDIAINSMRLKLSEAEDRRKRLAGRYGPPTDPEALAKYNQLIEEERARVPDAVSECSNAILNVWSVTTLSEAKAIAECIVTKYGTSADR